MAAHMIFCIPSVSWFYLVCEHVCVLSCSVMSALCSLLDYSPTGTSVHGLSRQGYWNGLPFPPPGDPPDPRIKPMSSVSPALTGVFFTTEPSGKPLYLVQRARFHIVFSTPIFVLFLRTTNTLYKVTTVDSKRGSMHLLLSTPICPSK